MMICKAILFLIVLLCSIDGLGLDVKALAYDGEWKGVTDQGYDVSFTVVNNGVTRFSIKHTVHGYYCAVTTTASMKFSPPISISGNSFTISGSHFDFQTGEYDNYEYVGMFSGDSSCTGTWESEDHYCVGSGNGGWSANRVIPEPKIAISPKAFEVAGHVYVGSSKSQPFTINNLGTADLLIDYLSITGMNASEFAIENDTCSGNTIAPSETCTFDVMFLPTSAGEKSANIEIVSNDPNTPTLNLPLNGTAVIRGDLNRDGLLNLADAVLALQVVCGLNPQGVDQETDVNGDAKIGVEEAIYILQAVSGLR